MLAMGTFPSFVPDLEAPTTATLSGLKNPSMSEPGRIMPAPPSCKAPPFQTKYLKGIFGSWVRSIFG